jgi:hypothetical protein
MKQSVRRRAAALALAVTIPTGIGVLVANTALLATTADGGMPQIMPEWKPLGGKTPVTGPVTTVPDPVDVID